VTSSLLTALAGRSEIYQVTTINTPDRPQRLRAGRRQQSGGTLMALYKLDNREHATVLAALRYWQRKGLMDDPVAELDIASDGGTLDPLAADEIDALCEGLNHNDQVAESASLCPCDGTSTE
jgi:hypothetical protein